MREISTTIRTTANKEKKDSTLKGYVTSVSKFFELITTLCYSAVEIYHRSKRLNDQDTQYITALLFAYIADVQKSQRKHTTCKDYAGQVSIWWKIVTSVPLWTEDMFANTAGFMHSLKKIKRFTPATKLGICSADILVMLATLYIWASSGKQINKKGSRQSGGTWNMQLYNLLSAQWTFVFSNTMRFGESDDPGDATFDFSERITISNVSISINHLGIRILSLVDPGRKVVNSFTGKPIAMEFNDDPLNWPTLMERWLLSHPVHPVHAAQTPVFRDPRGLSVKDGFFPPRSTVLTSAWSMRIMRSLIEANPDHFVGRLDSEGKASFFGLHSFKIGHFNELLDLGAAETEAKTLGRWDSAAFRDYHRMSQKDEFNWSRKASQGQAKPKQL